MMTRPIQFGSKVQELSNDHRTPTLKLQLEPGDGPLYDQGYRTLSVGAMQLADQPWTVIRLAKAEGFGEEVQKGDLDEFRKIIAQAPIVESKKDYFLKHTTADVLGF